MPLTPSYMSLSDHLSSNHIFPSWMPTEHSPRPTLQRGLKGQDNTCPQLTSALNSLSSLLLSPSVLPAPRLLEPCAQSALRSFRTASAKVSSVQHVSPMALCDVPDCPVLGQGAVHGRSSTGLLTCTRHLPQGLKTTSPHAVLGEGVSNEGGCLWQCSEWDLPPPSCVMLFSLASMPNICCTLNQQATTFLPSNWVSPTFCSCVIFLMPSTGLRVPSLLEVL